MTPTLDTTRLKPGVWFVRAGRWSRGVRPVTAEGHRVVAIYIALVAGALVAGIALYALTGGLAWLGLSLAGLIGSAVWFATVSGRHLDRSLRYPDLKVKTQSHA